MIRLKLFGLLKTLANNQTDISVPLDGGKKIEDLVGLLDKEYPAMAELVHKKKVLISVNQEIAHPETIIQEGDEVLLSFPPQRKARGKGLLRSKELRGKHSKHPAHNQNGPDQNQDQQPSGPAFSDLEH